MKVAVIGSGPAGLAASIKASVNHDVYLFEKNSSCGKKLLLTGSGRCNLGHTGNLDKECIYSSNKDILDKLIDSKKFKDYYNWLDSLGIILINRNGYLYPRCEKASSVKTILERKAIKNGVKFRYDTNILDVSINNDKFVVDGKMFDYLIIATGSFAMPKTGSTGDGYKIALNFGHNINKVRPSLTPLVTNSGLERILKGIRHHAKVSLFENDNLIKEEVGELQFTEYGLSGICIFNLSRYVSIGIDNNYKEEIRINFLPEVDDIKEFFEKRSKLLSDDTISEICDGFLDYRITNALLNYLHIDKDKKYKNISDDEKDRFILAIGNFPIKIVGVKDFTYSQVCSGGISLCDININTMESKLVKNLYFAGEILDIDGDCGGYNLKSAFVTGLIAGELQ